MLLVAGVLIWPMTAIYAKRLHDMDVSAWWLLVLPAITIAAELTSLDGWHLATWVSGARPRLPSGKPRQQSISASIRSRAQSCSGKRSDVRPLTPR